MTQERPDKRGFKTIIVKRDAFRAMSRMKRAMCLRLGLRKLSWSDFFRVTSREMLHRNGGAR